MTAMCLASKPAQTPAPAPVPVVVPKPMVSPEDASRMGDTTVGNRKTNSRSSLRLDLGGATTGTSGLNLPV